MKIPHERNMSIKLANALKALRHDKAHADVHDAMSRVLYCCTSMERVTPNGRKLMHRMGYIAGWPDWLFIASPNPLLPAIAQAPRIMFMEIKAGATPMSPEQRAVHAAMIHLGHLVVVRRSVETAVQAAIEFARGAWSLDYEA